MCLSMNQICWFFLDETGTDCRNFFENMATVCEGNQLKNKYCLSEVNVSGIANISVNGLLDVRVVKGAVNREVFTFFTIMCRNTS